MQPRERALDAQRVRPETTAVSGAAFGQLALDAAPLELDRDAVANRSRGRPG